MFLNRFSFKNFNLLYKYFLENPKNYIIFSSITSIVALLEFLGISSLLIAVSILLGEKIVFFESYFPTFNNYITSIEPIFVFTIYLLLILTQTLVQTFNESIFISFMADWRTKKSIEYIRNILSADFISQQNLSISDVQTIITRNIGFAVRIRYRLAVFIGDNILSIIYILMSIILAPVSTVLFIFLGLIYILINKYIIKYRLRFSEKAQEEYLKAGKISYEYMSDFRGLLISNVKNFTKKINDTIFQASNYQRYNDIINIILRNIHTPLILIILLVGIIVSKFIFNLQNSEILITLLIFYRAQPKIVSAALGFGNIIEDSPVDIVPELEKWNSKEIENIYENKNNKIDKLEEIKLENVTLKYGNKEIFKNLNLEIKGNQITSIVGKSGIGKSTVLDVICGFKNIDEGKIKINNFEYKYLNIKQWMQKNCAILRKESNLVSGTFLENVAFLDNNINEKEILELLRILDLTDLLDKNLFLKTNILLKGNNLSAGQQQRILLARALYKKPKLLILDEPTSHLDKITQEKFNEVINLYKGKITIIIVTHRDEILKVSDKIIKF